MTALNEQALEAAARKLHGQQELEYDFEANAPIFEKQAAEIIRAYMAALDPAPGWQDMSSAPRDGTKFLAWADGYEWPETICWQDYDADVADEVGEPGYFRYADDVLAGIAEVEQDLLTLWCPLPSPPRQAGGHHGA